MNTRRNRSGTNSQCSIVENFDLDDIFWITYHWILGGTTLWTALDLLCSTSQFPIS